MTRRWLAAAAVLVVALTACTRGSGSATNATPLQVYTAGPTVQQIQNVFKDSSWWPSVPSFVLRPLDLEYTPQTIKFRITQRYVRLGSGDSLSVDYVVYSSTSNATTFMSNEQTGLGANVQTTPKAGDQVLYTGQKQPTATALYESAAFIRTGPIVIVADLMQGSGFGVTTLGKLATTLVSRVKDVLSNKLKPAPLGSADESLLPPPGTDMTLLGAAKLPIEVVAGLINAAAPQTFVSTFTSLGVSDFVYGDYALNADLHMEIRAAAFNFTSAGDASSWMDSAVGNSNLSNGMFTTYSDALKQYLALILVDRHVGMLLCKSTLDTEAAARSCEAPLTRLLPAWGGSLTSVS